MDAQTGNAVITILLLLAIGSCLVLPQVVKAIQGRMHGSEVAYAAIEALNADQDLQDYARDYQDCGLEFLKTQADFIALREKRQKAFLHFFEMTRDLMQDDRYRTMAKAVMARMLSGIDDPQDSDRALKLLFQ